MPRQGAARSEAKCWHSRAGVPLLERYLRLDAESKWAHEARKLLLACRAVLSPHRRGSEFPAPRRSAAEAGAPPLLTPLRP